MNCNCFIEKLFPFQVEVKTIVLKLKPLDRRFGFSVIGGSDYSFPARIDEISEGNF